MRLRVSIRAVMVVVLACGVGLAALRYASEAWSSVVFTATLLGFALAAAYASQRRGPRRAFWLAFVAFGTGYLVLAFGPWCESSIRPRLISTKVLDRLYARVHPAASGPTILLSDLQGSGLAFSPDGRLLAPKWIAPASLDRFQEIGHCLAAWMLAVLGGYANCYCYERRDERQMESIEKAAGV